MDSACGRRVVVSGAGILSSIASGREAFWDGLERGTNGASRIELDGVGGITACVIDDLNTDRIPRREAKRMDRVGLLAVAAASQAFEDAGSPRSIRHAPARSSPTSTAEPTRYIARTPSSSGVAPTA